jgi:flavin reductase (DIM6/NTAB) family NADH-FMN oxidoreductase RutF
MACVATTEHEALAPPMHSRLREALRRTASTVTIVTSRDAEGTPHGMLASAVIPVSMEPPSMLVSVNRSASLHPILCRSRRFCVNVMSDRQHALVDVFSQTALRDQRFRCGHWSDARAAETERPPWLPDALSVVDCEVDVATDYGTHTVFIGRVTDVWTTDDPAARPLVWMDGQRVLFAAPG